MTDPASNHVSFTNESLSYLKESGGWGTFLAIVGFIYVAFIIVLGFFANTIFATVGSDDQPMGIGLIVGAIYIGIGIIYFFPVLYLFRFSTQVKTALERKSTEDMTAALGNLKSLFKFMGILTAIALGISVIALVSFGAGTFFR